MVSSSVRRGTIYPDWGIWWTCLALAGNVISVTIPNIFQQLLIRCCVTTKPRKEWSGKIAFPELPVGMFHSQQWCFTYTLSSKLGNNIHTLHTKREQRLGINVLPRSVAPCLLCHQHTFVSAYEIIFHPCYKNVHAIRLKDATCFSIRENEIL
jgi:hypothetical protein